MTKSNEKVSETVAKEILYQIHCQKIIPGSRLYESEIADQLGMSRTPVRQALDQMVADGIFERIPNRRGVFFPPLTPDDLEQVLACRETLEVAIAKLVVEKITPAGLESLEKSFDQQILFHERKKSHESYGYINSGFHLTLASLSGNVYFVQSLKRVFWRFRLYDFYLGGFRRREKDELIIDGEMVRISNEGHRRIIDAIKEKDGELAAEMARLHMKESALTGGYRF